MDTRTNRTHSPSARFYANRQSEGPEVFDVLPHLAPAEQPLPRLVPPFSHFQGFSAPASSRRYINNCAACLSDERVSPRTAIPFHDHREWEPPRQHMENLSDENDHMPSTGYGSLQHYVGSHVHTHEHSHGLSSPERARQLSEPPTYITPPPQYFLSPENAPAFAERPVSLMLTPRETTVGPVQILVQHHGLGRNTIRVPSNSDVSDAGQQPRELTTVRPLLAANEEGEPASISGDDEDASSTVYPYDSTSMASSSTAFHADHGGPARPLEEAVVEVHNTCLAATHRYLESLRVNWELRHGREILTTSSGLAGPTRRIRDRAGARGSPYSLQRRQTRRALSDNSGLEYMRGLREDEDASEDGGTQGRRQQPQACPIPAPTDSLLQNTSRICELIWRRARRDREDVLGAEAGGARRIALLVECAEAVVLYDAAEWDGDPERAFYAACRAGRDLCQELGDFRGIGRVDGIIERGEV
ncbi:hypothetical protein INS49_008137 [Diaporthe citri]|uniref:uncharacterized protein n=1 Tax=Diaporthe citri TaxID=83186 RepID=UPI001C7F10D6|nr:uncharacterized protein INS49_008137 [Diaporthe citri]KAG6363042.1 hypothetical protein INS49_008137 [Diaporthe citri]